MEIFEEIKEKLPSNSMISHISFEGSEIVVYTKNRDLFREDEGRIKKIAKEWKKRIDLRADPTIRKDMEDVKEIIEELIPKKAEVKDVTFEPGFSRVIIEANKPGLVIGKGGKTLKKIKKKTLWSPVVKRAPAIKSDVVDTVRKVLYKESEFRKEFLHEIGKEIHKEKLEEVDYLRITGLGGNREVGKSCFLLQTPNSNVMLDCGIKMGEEAFPYLQAPEVDLDKLNGVIASHPHLDHVGFIPYLYQMDYKGPLYCTPPTRDLMVLLCLDYLDVAQKEGKEVPYDSKSIEKAVKHSIPLEYDEVSDITRDMRLTFQRGSHVLGSSLVHLHVGYGAHNLVYTGDFNYGRSKLFSPAFTNFRRVETLLMESTYGGSNDMQPSRKEAEEKLIKITRETLDNGGRVLIPSFAVGRAQEVMCIFSDLKDFDYPFYLEGMLWDATAIHTTYPEYMTKRIQNKILHKNENPFTNKMFNRVGSSKERKEILRREEPFGVITTSGMLTGGPVMEYLKNFAEHEKNTLIFVGYQHEGTLGRRIQNGWDTVPIMENGRQEGLKINMNVETVEGLSGHSDRNQLINYVYKLKSKPNRIICCHGEKSKVIDLSSSLHKLFKIKTNAPKNLETIRLI